MFLTPIKVVLRDDNRYPYELLEDIRYDWHGHIIEVKAGFKTDFASVPRLPIIFAVLGDLPASRGAAILHDAAYRFGFITRKEADQLFYDAMILTGVPWWKARLMWMAVRVFGGLFGTYNPGPIPQSMYGFVCIKDCATDYIIYQF